MYSNYCSDAEQLTYATVAQLVEYDLAKVGVAGSNPVCRSCKNLNLRIEIFLFNRKDRLRRSLELRNARLEAGMANR